MDSTPERAEYIPIMLNVSKGKVIVIGGGQAAHKKVINLIPHCKSIIAIADEFDPEFSGLSIEKVKLHIVLIDQINEYLRKENIIIIATDDRKLNDMISRECLTRGVLFNRVDDNRSPFIFPASFQKEGIVVSVSTLGKSPSLSRFIRDRLEKDVAQYAKGFDVIKRLRADIHAPDLHTKALFFNTLFQSKKFWKLISECREAEAYDLGKEVFSDMTPKQGSSKKIESS
ncbi:MAG: bifunctional precorrin-2 dehydrogenase/sirohydrochlorin ferrochelatase [Thermoplasmataceae archaeon]